MSKAKSAVVEKEIVKAVRYYFTCPHCKTVVVGGFDDDCLKIKCCHCDKPVNLIYDSK